MIFADLHIHVGQSLDGRAVKITASPQLNLPNIIETARDIKGLSMIGVIDAQSPGVIKDFEILLNERKIRALAGGGYEAGSLVIIPGTEIELKIGDGEAHFLAYFSDIEHIGVYVEKLKPYVKNWQLSSQKAYVGFPQWLEAVEAAGGIWMPAHIFTPHKGIYGNCCARMQDVMQVLPQAAEMGLSADRMMAGNIRELDNVLLFSNSDAHSLPKIGREYNALVLSEKSFTGLKDLWQGKGQLAGNYGLPPQLGKYHRTYCLSCEQVVTEQPPQTSCPHCGSAQVIIGVLDRLEQISDNSETRDEWPQDGGTFYVYQASLKDLPGIGPKMYMKLLNELGTEINILHEVPFNEIERLAGPKIADWIKKDREGTLNFSQGGGGFYGKVF